VELVLVRHAEPTDDFRGRCYGRLDIELSEAGVMQSRRLATALADEPVAALVSSPRVRARATADAIAEPHGLTVQVVDDLRELDFGDVEGMTYDEIAVTRPEFYAQWMASPTTVRFPGGEGYVELQARVLAAVAGLREAYEGRVVVAVSHGGPIRAVAAEALGLAPDRIFRLAIEPASITRVAWHDGVPTVRCLNQTSIASG
jgi:broad specificity phosphatase PhoE